MTAIAPSHEPWLVALSLLVAFQGSYVGLHLARGIGEARGLARRRRITFSALSLALAVWSMHFVGMLALRLPVAVDFLVLPTLISFLVCVLVVGFAVFFVGARAPGPRTIATAAVFMGGGIVIMHFLGMYAVHEGVHMRQDPLFAGASMAIGVAAAGAALWFGFAGGVTRSILPSAAIMALAISAMHYTAMAGATFEVHATTVANGQPALSPGTLAAVVSIVAFVVSGLFLLTLVPEETEAAPASASATAPASAGADGVPAAGPAAGPAQPAPLPVERDGRRLAFDVHRLVAVQAQGHYCQLFDGDQTWFCPLSISEVEALLDPAMFARVHRSHIVNLDQVRAMRRYGDAGLISLATPVPYQVPVARSRRGWLRDLLQTRVRAAE